MSRVNVCIQILSYNKGEYKKLLKKVARENQPKAGVLPKPLAALLVEKYIQSHEGKEEFSRFINEKINPSSIDEDNKVIVSVDRIILDKRGDEMKIQVEIDNLNLKQLITNLLPQKKEGDFGIQTEEKENGTELFNTLRSLNNSIDDEQKFELIKYLLNWTNRNEATSPVVDLLIKSFPEVKDVLEPLQLKVKNITLED